MRVLCATTSGPARGGGSRCGRARRACITSPLSKQGRERPGPWGQRKAGKCKWACCEHTLMWNRQRTPHTKAPSGPGWGRRGCSMGSPVGLSPVELTGAARPEPNTQCNAPPATRPHKRAISRVHSRSARLCKVSQPLTWEADPDVGRVLAAVHAEAHLLERLPAHSQAGEMHILKQGRRIFHEQGRRR